MKRTAPASSVVERKESAAAAPAAPAPAGERTHTRVVSDAYVRYTHEFFRKWLPVYDLFSASVAPIYRAASRELGRAAAGQTMIDLCAGTGEMALRCARAGWNVTAFDITPEMLDKARRKRDRLAIEFAIGDARHLPFATGAFDAAVISLALHDMPRKVRAQVLREAVRVARDRLVVVDYDFPAGLPLRRGWLRAIELFESAYFRRYVEDGGIEPLLDEVGLQTDCRRRRGLPLFAVYVIDLGCAKRRVEAK